MLLRTAARVELLSLLVLLANLATVHVAGVATLLGPLHGCAYLVVIGATFAATGRTRPRLLALIPGIGGALAARSAARNTATSAARNGAGNTATSAARNGAGNTATSAARNGAGNTQV
ncbi:hypothetical protein GCM10027087_17650 [Paractinoplanes abujensis]